MSNKSFQNNKKAQSGFSLVEAVIAIFILTIGLIGTAAAITYALEFTTISRNVTTAKTMIVASIEEIESLRNSRRLDFKQIANAGSVNNTNTPSFFNGFSNGLKDVSLNPGPDGVNGTDDDLIDKGTDGIYGTTDDVSNPTWVRSGYKRQITVSVLSDTLKKVEVKIRYMASNGKTGELTGVCYLNDEARITR
jgi:type II secretory pathway pseudopilin PulG